MNKRIRELAEQAGMTDDKFGMFFAKNNHDDDGVDLEKFAELIVRECATLTLDPMQIDDAQYYHGWLDYRDKIWKHFGEKA